MDFIFLVLYLIYSYKKCLCFSAKSYTRMLANCVPIRFRVNLLSVVVSCFHYYNLICVYGGYCTVTVRRKDTVTNKIRATAFSVLHSHK